MKKPKRKDIPDKIALAVYMRQNGRCHKTGRKLGHFRRQAEYHHDPELELRAINDDGTDYIPPQLDPDYIFAMLPSAHSAETNGDPDVEKRHMLRKDYSKAKISKNKRLRESHREFKEGQASKVCGQKRQKSGKWPSRPFSKKGKK